MSLKDVFSQPVPREEFAARILTHAKAFGLVGDYDYDPERFSIIARGERALRLKLANAYSEYRSAGRWHRANVITTYARILARLSVPEEINQDDAKFHLLPRIRERVLFENLTIESQLKSKPGPEFVYRVLGEHLTLEVVYDEPATIRTVSADDLRTLGLTFEDALAVANQNMLAFGASNFKALRPGLYLSEWQDDYDASRLHLPQVVPHLSVKGRPVAMIPSRDTLLVTGADDAAGLAMMARTAEGILTRPRAMSGIAFRLDGGWTPFLPPPGHPAFVPLQRLAAQTMAGYYASQKHVLDTLYRTRGEDIFVAGVILTEDKTTTALSSVATWGEGATTLLPVVDKIAFIEPDNNTIHYAAWDRVLETMGDMMEPQGLYPERYRVRAFPPANLIAEAAES